MIDTSRKATGAIGSANRLLHKLADQSGTFLVDGFHLLALFAIGAATVWAAVSAFLGMVASGHVTIDDLLLLFIYLEIGAMVGIYFKTNRMPVRFLVYVAITALTRHLIVVINASHGSTASSLPEYNVLVISAAIVILAAAILIIRYASWKYPSGAVARDDADLTDADST